MDKGNSRVRSYLGNGRNICDGGTMKKLTKRVQAGGLWFDVPKTSNYVSITDTGAMCVSITKPMIYLYSQDKGWQSKDLSVTSVIVELEGADWRKCCWYVGDQVDGDAVERREWMADGIVKWLTSGNSGWNGTTKEAGHFAAKIRSGEIE